MQTYTKNLKPGDRYISHNTEYKCISVKTEGGKSLVQFEIPGLKSAYWTASLSMVEVLK